MEVIFSSIEANQLKLPAIHRRPTTVMFPYTFLEAAGTAMEKELNKFQLFFDVCGGSPEDGRQLKWSASNKEFNFADESPVGRRQLKSYMETGLKHASTPTASAESVHSFKWKQPLESLYLWARMPLVNWLLHYRYSIFFLLFCFCFFLSRSKISTKLSFAIFGRSYTLGT